MKWGGVGMVVGDDMRNIDECLIGYGFISYLKKFRFYFREN